MESSGIDIGFNPINDKIPIVENNRSKIFLKNLSIFLIYVIPAAIVFVGVYFLMRYIIQKQDKNNKLSHGRRLTIQILAGAVNALLVIIILKVTMHTEIRKLAYSFVY